MSWLANKCASVCCGSGHFIGLPSNSMVGRIECGYSHVCYLSGKWFEKYLAAIWKWSGLFSLFHFVWWLDFLVLCPVCRIKMKLKMIIRIMFGVCELQRDFPIVSFNGITF